MYLISKKRDRRGGRTENKEWEKRVRGEMQFCLLVIRLRIIDLHFSQFNVSLQEALLQL